MTVIYSNFGDKDTEVLTNLWKGLNANVVELKSKQKSIIAKARLKEALESEKDTILFCGHGTPSGLFNPSGPELFAITDKDAPNIKAKNIIGIWCYASEYAKHNNLRGFYSYMFISSPSEAKYMHVKDPGYEEITKSEILFCNRVNKLIKDNVPMDKWVNILQSFELTNDIERFNYSKLYYHD